jgi:hypothetical protein
MEWLTSPLTQDMIDYYNNYTTIQTVITDLIKLTKTVGNSSESNNMWMVGQQHAIMIKESMKLVIRMSKRMNIPIFLSGRDCLPMYILCRKYGANVDYRGTVNSGSVYRMQQGTVGKCIFLDTGFRGSVFMIMRDREVLTHPNESKMFLLAHSLESHDVQVSKLNKNKVALIEDQVPKIYSSALEPTASKVNTTRLSMTIEYTRGVLDNA